MESSRRPALTMASTRIWMGFLVNQEEGGVELRCSDNPNNQIVSFLLGGKKTRLKYLGVFFKCVEKRRRGESNRNQRRRCVHRAVKNFAYLRKFEVLPPHSNKRCQKFKSLIITLNGLSLSLSSTHTHLGGPKKEGGIKILGKIGLPCR